MKKLIGLMLLAVMGLSTTAFAANNSGDNGVKAKTKKPVAARKMKQDKPKTMTAKKVRRHRSRRSVQRASLRRHHKHLVKKTGARSKRAATAAPTTATKPVK
jgi:Flp pilus assembly protein TadB